MTTPVDERPEPNYVEPQYNFSDVRRSHETGRSRAESTLPSYNVNRRSMDRNAGQTDKSSEEDNTVVGENEGFLHDHEQQRKAAAGRPRAGSHLTVDTQYIHDGGSQFRASPSQTREQNMRLDDDLAMLKVERQISRIAEERAAEDGDLYRSRSRRREEHVDEFDEATNPVHEKTQVYKPLEHPESKFGKIVRQIHKSNWLIRYFTYILPLTLILLIPLLLGALIYKQKTVGGVYLVWFMIWLEIVWLTLWAGRILAKCLPWPIGLVSSLFTNNSKKWRDMGKQLELPATLFFWWLAIEISFLPTMVHHQKDFGSDHTAQWMNTTNKVLVSIFVGAVLNFFEKIIIQLIAISFHLRTYADRIELNKFQIGSLTKLYAFSKEKIAMEDSEFEEHETGIPSGARTPGQLVTDAARTTKDAVTKFGDIAGKVAGDFTGRKTVKSSHPSQVTLALLSTTSGSQVLARRLYRTFAREETQTVYSDDLKNAFENDEEAEAAFSMFDKDMNGDISMEELEAVCVEIGREPTAITSAGSAVLALSWLFSATAQEFLQSVIFVFVKHPFDVGDRVSVYGNTGALGRGDDYFVKEISLLYTEFKKMEGHVVQAPNSYLNTLFILNQRRSGGLAEAVSITIKFGTTLDQIDGLRTKLLEFVKAEKREYQGNILTELRDIVEVHSMNLNVVFFYKSNWQNEGLRLARRNKFICAMMVSMQELGIEGPYMRFPGLKQSFPMYLQNVPHVAVPGTGHSGHPDMPGGYHPEEQQQQQQAMQDGPQDPPFVSPAPGQENTTGSMPPYNTSRVRSGSTMRSTRARGESLSAMNKRVDFSLGASSLVSGDFAGDVYADRERVQIPIEITEASRDRRAAASRRSQDDAYRPSQETARSTSRDTGVLGMGNLARRNTEGEGRWGTGRSSGSVHRNRFFGRGRADHDESGLMENGMMADIPEVPSTTHNSASNTPLGQQRLDPRTGMISPAAWRTRTDESNVHPSVVGSGALAQDDHAAAAPAGHRFPGRSQTEDFEMRRFR
nr:putative mscs family protein [Quercus suber]